jgi:archaellum component FlaC
MTNKPNQPQTNDAVLGGQSSPTSLSQCPVCKTEYTQGEVNRCSICNWDLTPCPEAFVEKHNAQLAWAREMWINFQAQEKQLHASQSQLEDVKQDKARFEGEVLHRLEQLEQAQDKSEPVIWAQLPQDTSKLDELEKQLSRIKEQLKGSEQKRQEIQSEVAQLSAQIAKFEAELQKKRADDPSLISEAGIDYIRLQNFLVAGEWEKANSETGAIINTLLYRLGEKSLEPKQWQWWGKTTELKEEYIDFDKFYQRFKKLPCKELNIIDKLWIKYSYGRFGFSIQQRLYDSFKRDIVALVKAIKWASWDYEEERYYWNEEDEYKKYSINAPVGHLPIIHLNNCHDYEVIYYLPFILKKISSCGSD